MSRLFILLLFLPILTNFGCGGGQTESQDNDAPPPKSMVEETSDDPMKNKGIGPVKSVSLSSQVDHEMASEGEKLYNQYCTACHKPTEKSIGPAPKGIFERRSPEWIMNMILNPEEMVIKDPIARQVLIEYNMAPMANQGLTQEQARKILEYFRTIE